jgi:hypothetical protein
MGHTSQIVDAQVRQRPAVAGQVCTDAAKQLGLGHDVLLCCGGFGARRGDGAAIMVRAV